MGANSTPSFDRAPRRAKLLAFLFGALAICLLTAGIVTLEAGEDCGKYTGRNCAFSLAPDHGLEFVGSLLCLLALPFAMGTPAFVHGTLRSLRLHPERQVPWDPDPSPQLDLANSLHAPAAAASRLRVDVRFRINSVIDGPMGRCTVVGELTEGEINPPVNLRLVPGPGSSTVGSVVRVVDASGAHARAAGPGGDAKCRLTLAGVGNTRTKGRILGRRGWWIDPGDQLTSV